MATFGDTHTDSTYSRGNLLGDIVLGKYAMPSTGTVTDLAVLIYNEGPMAFPVKVLLYDDDGAGGAPGTRLYVSSPITIGADITDYVRATFSLFLTAGNYWLGAVLSVDASLVCLCYATTGGTHGIYSDSSNYTTPPSTLPTFTSTGTYVVEAYATYTPTPIADLTPLIQFGHC